MFIQTARKKFIWASILYQACAINTKMTQIETWPLRILKIYRWCNYNPKYWVKCHLNGTCCREVFGWLRVRWGTLRRCLQDESLWVKMRISHENNLWGFGIERNFLAYSSFPFFSMMNLNPDNIGSGQRIDFLVNLSTFILVQINWLPFCLLSSRNSSFPFSLSRRRTESQVRTQIVHR